MRLSPILLLSCAEPLPEGAAPGLGERFVLTDYAWSLQGTQLDEQFGSNLEYADVTGDGLADLLVSAPGYDAGAGRISVYAGSAAGLPTTPTFTLDGPAGSAFGTAEAVDIDADGDLDLLVGAWSENSTGRVHLFEGSPAGIATTSTTFEVADTSGFGYAVASAGDLNADGYPDVAVGAPYYYLSTGRVYVYHGSSSGLASVPDTVLTGLSSPSNFGAGVVGAGDVNGDGYDDLAASADGGQYAQVYYGSASGVSSASVDLLTTPSEWGMASKITPGADLDGDGYSDLVVSAQTWPDLHAPQGRVYTFHGSDAGIESTPDLLSSPAGASQFGRSLSILDLDGDGYDELLVGSFGGLWLYVGTPTGFGTAPFLALNGSGSGFGAAPTAVDLDGDPWMDLVVSDLTGVGQVYGFYGFVDEDGDGVVLGGGPVDQDCDDGDVAVGEPPVWYEDADNDGTGSPASIQVACEQPAGYVSDATDCNDSDANVSPLAPELCDTLDNDCNGAADDGLPFTPFYADADGDGYGVPSDTVQGCAAPEGYAAASGDCDEGDELVNPGATETCNEIDDDCDSSIDEDVAGTFYADADGDGFGDGALPADGCSAPAGHVTDDSDCDDEDAAVYPGAAEACNALDDNCDSAVDEGLEQRVSYADTDGDGYGDPTASVSDCATPEGYVEDGTDCDDTDAGLAADCEEKGGCGCSSTNGPSFAWPLLLALLATPYARARRGERR